MPAKDPDGHLTAVVGIEVNSSLPTSYPKLSVAKDRYLFDGYAGHILNSWHSMDSHCKERHGWGEKRKAFSQR